MTVYEQIEFSRRSNPYLIGFEYPQPEEMTTARIHWLVDQSIPVVRDSGPMYSYFRFSNLEDATLFKLAFGGDFIDVSVKTHINGIAL